DVILDRTAEELIGGILVALLLSLILAGAFALLRKKITDATTLITCLALLVNLVGMTVAAGYVRNAARQGMRMNQGLRSGVPGPPMVLPDRTGPRARAIFEKADTNGDGQLSSGEAAVAADAFVKGSEAVEGGPLNEAQLRAALRRNMGPPPESFAPLPDLGPA